MSRSADDYPEFSDVISILELGPSEVEGERPPPELWRRIEAGLVAEANVDADAESDGSDDVDESDDSDDYPGYDPEVVSLSDRRRSRRGGLFAVAVGVAAALLLIALPVGLAFRSAGNDVPDRQAELAVLAEDFGGTGSAELAGRDLRVDVEGLVAPEGSFHELWLLEIVDGELQDLRSLGEIDADGTWEIDESVDLDRFTVVDISVEPIDDNPDHSGDSVLRGDLSA